MARWKLLNKHYLMVPGTEYEYKESGATGRQKKLVLPVPLFLDPEYEPDCNYPATFTEPAMIVVCHEGQGLPQDIVFTGPPGPDMQPLDDEARAVSDAEAKNWQRPMDMAYTGDFGEMLLATLNRKLDAVSAGKPTPAEPGEMEKLQAQNAALAAQLAALQENPVRRV